jgi:uncharacterized protein YehS (DUF1456 family)
MADKKNLAAAAALVALLLRKYLTKVYTFCPDIRFISFISGAAKRHGGLIV